MRFIRDAVITIVVLIVIAGLLTYSRIHAGGLSADRSPGEMEQAVATRLVRLAIPADAQRAVNPFRSDDAAWRTAADHFEDHCALCHAPDGHGRTEMGENMYPKVPDLADEAVQRLSDGALFYIIQNGVRWTGMPAWRHEHSAEETWRLVSFVRRVPVLTEQKLREAGVHIATEEHDHEHRDHMDHDRMPDAKK